METNFQKAAIGLNKKMRTRGVLIDSAVEAFSRDGISNATINDIAIQAGLSIGTFYNHFKDKEELASATAIAIVMELSKCINESMPEIDDASIRLAVYTSSFLELVLKTEHWGAILVDSFHYLVQFRRTISVYIKKEIQNGINQRKFDAEADEFLLEQISALTMSSIRNQLRTGYSQKNVDRTCNHILRTLGLTPSQASKVLEKARKHIDATKSQLSLK